MKLRDVRQMADFFLFVLLVAAVCWIGGLVGSSNGTSGSKGKIYYSALKNPKGLTKGQIAVLQKLENEANEKAGVEPSE